MACALSHDVLTIVPTLVTHEAGNEISMGNNGQEAMQGREPTAGTQRLDLGE